MRAGLFRHRVTVTRTFGGVQDTYGERAPGATVLGTFWASIEPLNGRELWEAQQVQSDVTHRVRLRYHAGVKFVPADIVTYTDPVTAVARVFNIDTVVDDMERRRTVEMLCVERNEVVV